MLEPSSGPEIRPAGLLFFRRPKFLRLLEMGRGGRAGGPFDGADRGRDFGSGTAFAIDPGVETKTSRRRKPRRDPRLRRSVSEDSSDYKNFQEATPLATIVLHDCPAKGRAGCLARPPARPFYTAAPKPRPAPKAGGRRARTGQPVCGEDPSRRRERSSRRVGSATGFIQPAE